jgi:hypothetical protein
MSNNNYNYAIEKHLAQFGGEADKNITRTCGNCCAYDSVIAICNRDDEPENTIEATEQGCWYHKTHDEQKRLEELVKQRQDEASRLRLEEQRRNGMGDCEGCPCRNVNKEMYALLLDIVTDYQCMPNPAVMADKIEAVLKKARGEK